MNLTVCYRLDVGPGPGLQLTRKDLLRHRWIHLLLKRLQALNTKSWLWIMAHTSAPQLKMCCAAKWTTVLLWMRWRQKNMLQISFSYEQRVIFLHQKNVPLPVVTILMLQICRQLQLEKIMQKILLENYSKDLIPTQ